MIEVFLIFLTFLIISLMLGILIRLDFSKIKEGDNANNNIIIRFFEKQKDYFNSCDILDKIIYISVIVFIFFVSVLLSLFITRVYQFIFFTSEITPLDLKEGIFKRGLRFTYLFAYYLTAHILLLIFYALLYIFAFWMIIKIFVPIIMLFLIPIPPLILPIPLQMLMLEKIPPFRRLTDRGILPLMEKLLNIFISNETIKNKFEKSFVSTYGFLYNEINNILGDFVKLSKASDTDNSNSLIEENKEDKMKEKKLLEDMKGDKLSDILKGEFEQCKRNISKNVGYGEEETVEISFDCNFDYLRNYLQNKS